jgi:hypothetical protein
VVDLHCAAITLAHGTVSLTPATVRDWAREGVTAYAIAGPSVPSFVTAYFHVPMG